MADDATAFNAWDPNTWENVHRMPKAFADPEEFSKMHTPNPDEAYFVLSGDYTSQTKISMKRDIWEHDSMEIHSADSAADLKTERKDEGKDKQLVVKDKDGTVLAICHKESTWVERVYKIYSPRSLFDGQTPEKEPKLAGYGPVYAWAGIGDDTSAPMDPNAFKLHFIQKKKEGFLAQSKDVITGLFPGHQAGSTYYCNDDAKNFHYKTHARVIRKQVPGQQDDPAVGMFAPAADHKWRLLLAPGVDPVLFVCFLAITDALKAERKG